MSKGTHTKNRQTSINTAKEKKRFNQERCCRAGTVCEEDADFETAPSFETAFVTWTGIMHVECCPHRRESEGTLYARIHPEPLRGLTKAAAAPAC